MGYDSDSQYEDDEDEYEEPGGGNRLLGFMFGNVDGSGDLDVDYLDEDAKEHIAALADKLGSSLKDIDLSVKSLKTPSDATDQDYDKKAENAVDYKDFDEPYEGPEVQAPTEAEILLPTKDFLGTEVSVTLEKTCGFYDENYDDVDDDTEKQTMVVEQFSPLVEQMFGHEVLSQEESLPDDVHMHSLEMENLENAETEEDDSYSSEDSVGGDRSSVRPILCVKDGKAILQFSEIFSIHEEPIKKMGKIDCRYITHKEIYKSMDVSDIVEEDEYDFLKAPCCDFHWMRPLHMKSEDVMLDEGDSVKSGMGKMMSLGVDCHRKDSCASSEPMKDDASLSTFPEPRSPFSYKFYPLDQKDWEEKIIWNNSPSSSENFVESCELSGLNSDTAADGERDLEDGTQTLEPEFESAPHDKDHCSFLKSRSVLVEPFASNKYHHSMNVSISENRKHPQHLRLESRLDEAKLHSDGVRLFSQLTLPNRDVLEGSWLDDIVWEPHLSVEKPKLIFGLQDEQMLFEHSDIKDARELQRHAGAMIISCSLLPSSVDSHKLHGQAILSAGGFNISNDKFYSNRKSSQQLRSHSLKRAILGVKVLHSVPALKLQTMKAELSNKDVANFHRPKALWYPHDIEVPLAEQGKLTTQGSSIKIIMKSLGRKGIKLDVDVEETVSSAKAKASKKLDFKLSEPVKLFYFGRELEDNKSLGEQSVRPNSVLNLIRTKIHMLPRAQKLPGENKSRRPPGAFKKKSDLSVKDGHVFLMEYCEERPLLLGNAGMGARLCTYYRKSAPDDQTGNLLRNENKGLGSVVVLDPADKSPFLGDIKSGSSQSCIETNMYRSPIFQHKVSSTDYLLMRSSQGKLSIRRIDRIDVVGQQEPFIEVMSPGSKNVRFYIMNRLLVHMYRGFRASQNRGLRPLIRSDELYSQFPSLSKAFLRKRLKNCADLQREPNGQFLWVMKRNFHIPSEEELRRMVTPESVCAYESMQAGLYRLKQLGTTMLNLPTGLSSAMNQLPDEPITLATASHIERELQTTPWNLSSNFVSCINQDRENIERLEITGVGDPSGRCLGFSYVRSTPMVPVTNSVVEKKSVIGKGSTVTGTDADLRRLSMAAARELLLKFNASEDKIAKLTRWDQIALICQLSSVKVDPTTVSKFARGQYTSMQLQQQTREKCQEVWDRQVKSLCSADGEEIESGSETNSDLDSFAGDLENLLDAEAFEDGEEDNYHSKHDSVEEAEREKNKKTRALVKQSGLAFKSGPENAAGVEKNNVVAERIMQPESPYLSPENIARAQKGESFSEKHLPGKFKGKRKIEIEQLEILNKKIKIFGDGMNVIKEKTSARERFVCGACSQLGHMRTNKNCPNYREDSETRVESINLENGINVIKEKKSARESFVCGACGQLGHMRTNKNCPNYSINLEKPFGRPNSVDHQAEQKPPPKKLVPKTLTRVEAREGDKPTSREKVLKVKCGATNKLLDKLTSPTSRNSDSPFMPDVEIRNMSLVKVNKIIFSNKNEPEDVMFESHKPFIVIKPPLDADRDKPRKKIIIRQPKEIVNLDENRQGGRFAFDYSKTKKTTELSSLDKRREDESQNFFEESSRMRDPDGGYQWWVEEKRRNADRQQEERNRRPENMRMIDEQQKLNIKIYEEAFTREREEEEEQERQMEKAKKKKKKRKPEMRDDYLVDLPPPKQAEYAQATRRRRGGGEVGLSNILERIVETLRGRTKISFLFLKPVSKKEAPDYLDIISHPMDLSKIRDKARRMEYKNRDEFRHDVYQIAYNAHKYNDLRNPCIPPLADQLLDLCDHLLDQNDSSLTEAEEGIEI